MTFIPASFSSYLAFNAIVLFVLVLMIWGMNYSVAENGKVPKDKKQKIFFGIIIWLAIFTAFVASGVAIQNPMPMLPIIFVVFNLIALFFGLSSMGGLMAAKIPLHFLVLFQAFRLPLELVLHSWAEQGTIPTTMTWTGQNFDIVSGVVALIAFFIIYKGGRIAQAIAHIFAWTANLIGFALLLNVMRVAVFSSPLPFAWDIEPKLQLLFYLPYAYIAPVCVGGALAGHVILTRALLGRSLRKS